MLEKPRTTKGYLMQRPKKKIIDKKLNEISGIFYLKDEDAFIAIADDKKKIFKLTKDGAVSDYFDPELESADYEDLVKLKDTTYVLISDGTIVGIHQTDSSFVQVKHQFPSSKKNDFETLYYDSIANALIIICKNCAVDKGKLYRSAFKFNLPTRNFDTTAYYTINSKEVKDILKEGRVDFKPSGAAIHPIQKRLYVLSSAGNLMVITDLRGKVQEVFRLNPTLYPQSEGIAFTANGDMYVSNEAKLGKPTLLKIPYKPGK
jgi:uncharacterized protein YjiK